MTPSAIEPATFRIVASTNCATTYPDMLVVITEHSKGEDRSWTVKDLSCIRTFVVFNLLKTFVLNPTVALFRPKHAATCH
jgi:hypothetical protein